MSEPLTLARPYAQAAFTVASEAGTLGFWSEFLSAAALLVHSPEMGALAGSPKLPRERLVGLMADLLGVSGDAPACNFLTLLAENRRLPLLPEIASHYDTLRARAEQTIKAQLTSAQPVDDAARARITEALARRLGARVELECVVDEALLGGAVIRADDLVIDGSVKGRLARLATALTH
jgi:F-type H+-transporting ATPase subunit delta